jgi:release factor glutamine methyltransferase
MSISIAAAILEGTQILRVANVPEGRREAGSLLAHAIARDRTFLITHAGDLLEASDVGAFRECVARRALGEPLQYITGHQEFYGLVFEVNPAVLIPRPETEILVETVLELIGDAQAQSSICDVGTGSGCIAITLLHQQPRARAIAVDISAAALDVAARNAARHCVSERITFQVSDCFVALDKTAARFDLIVSNPPYIADKDLAGLQKEVRDYEPRSALTAADDGLSVIQRLLTAAPDFLIGGGHLVMEIGFGQRGAVERLCDPLVWKLLGIREDLQAIPRTVTLQKRDS